MKNQKIRFAILGTGPRGLGLAQTYSQHPDVEIVALCDIAEGLADEAAATLARENGQHACTFTSYEEMAKKSAYDAILIACDPDIQVQYAVEEMHRGIHVMTEVPAAYTVEQCYDLVRAVRATGAKYQLAEQTRYWHFISEWRKMAQAGDFGKILYAEGEYLHYEPCWDYFRHKKTGKHVWTNDPSYAQNFDYEPTWRSRCFADPIWYLPHELSPLLSITGGRITRVSCMGSRLGSYVTKGFAARDLECALMYNSNDTLFSLRAGFTSPFGKKREPSCHWYQIKGTEQSVESPHTTLDYPRSIRYGEAWTERKEWTCANPDADEVFRTANHGGADYYPIHYFVDAIQRDVTPPMDVYLAVETAAPAILAAESARQGGVLLEVPDFRL